MAKSAVATRAGKGKPPNRSRRVWIYAGAAIAGVTLVVLGLVMFTGHQNSEHGPWMHQPGQEMPEGEMQPGHVRPSH